METRSLGEISPKSTKLKRSRPSSGSIDPVADQGGSIGLVPFFNIMDQTFKPSQVQAKISCPIQSTLFLCLDRDGVIRHRTEGQSPSTFSCLSKSIVGKRFEDILPLYLADEINQTIREVQNDQQLVCREYQISGKHQTCWVEAHYIPMAEEQVGVVLANIQSRKQIELAYHILWAEISGIVQESFFSSLATKIAIALNLSDVMISQLVGDQLETVAWSSHGQLQDNISYAFEGTPCGLTLMRGQYHCVQSVQTDFPEDFGLVELRRYPSLKVPSNDLFWLILERPIEKESALESSPIISSPLESRTTFRYSFSHLKNAWSRAPGISGRTDSQIL